MGVSMLEQIGTTCGKFLKRWEYQTILPASWEICMQVKKQQLEPNMKQWTGSKLGKEYIKAVYYHPVYLTYPCKRELEIAGEDSPSHPSIHSFSFRYCESLELENTSLAS